MPFSIKISQYGPSGDRRRKIHQQKRAAGKGGVKHVGAEKSPGDNREDVITAAAGKATQAAEGS
jgi:hypothetical protein